MSQQPSILESEPVTGEQERLLALFDEMEKQQVDFLDQAGKRIVELGTVLLGVLFAVAAFGDKFPPPYLQGNTIAKVLTLATLALYLIAIVVAMRGLRPREYKRYRHNLTEMRNVLDEIISYKSRWLKAAGILFLCGTVSLSLLIGYIILTA